MEPARKVEGKVQGKVRRFLPPYPKRCPHRIANPIVVLSRGREEGIHYIRNEPVIESMEGFAHCPGGLSVHRHLRYAIAVVGNLLMSLHRNRTQEKMTSLAAFRLAQGQRLYARRGT